MGASQPPTPPTGLNFMCIAASTLIKTGEGDLHLCQISSSSSLVIRLWDNVSAATRKIIGSLAVNAGEEYDWPAHFTTGLYVEFVSGSGELTVFFI